jgi:hypothetical protein
VGEAGATFRPDSISADPSGVASDVIVAGALEGTFSPWLLSTGAFVARFDGASGAPTWWFPLPTFSHGELRAALRPDGLVFVAATARTATSIGSIPVAAPPQGALAAALVDPTLDDAVWVVTVASSSASATLVPVAAAILGSDLVIAGTGAGDFGCGPTGGKTFVAALSGADHHCLWSRGFSTQSISDVEPRDSGDVVVGGVCAPAAGTFDPQGGATPCTSGLWVAALQATTAAPTIWARTGSGTVSAVNDLAVAPDGSVTAIGEARGKVGFGGALVDFGTYDSPFAARFAADGTPGAVVRPIQAPYAPLPDAVSFDRCAGDRLGKLWIAGRYQGQPTLGGALFPECRPPACAIATYLARLEGDGTVSSFLPLRIAPLGDGSAFVEDLVLTATAGTLSHALGLTGSTSVGGSAWSSAGPADLGVLRIVPPP